MKKPPLNPFMIPFSARYWCKLFFIGVAVVWFYSFTQEHFYLLAPFVYIAGNLLAETILYRVFRLKESRFYNPKTIRKIFKLSPEQLDDAALKTNKIKLLFFAGSTTIGFMLILLFNDGIAPLAWSLLINAFLCLFLVEFVCCKRIKMPCLGRYVSVNNISDPFPCSNIEHINRSQGYGTIGGYIMSTRRDYTPSG